MRRRDREPAMAIDDEIRNHLEERVEALMAEGMPEAEARREARRRFGNAAEIRRRLREIDAPAGGPMDRLGERLVDLGQDLRHAWRRLMGSPGYTAAVVASIALGVGANATVFSVTDAVLLRPLPFPEPDRLVEVNAVRAPGQSGSWLDRQDLLIWLEATDSLGRPLVSARFDAVHAAGDDMRPVVGRAVSLNWLDVLGMRPQMGRSFGVDEAMPGRGDVVIASYGFWQQLLGGDRDAVGQTVMLDGREFTLIGVMGPEFKFPTLMGADLWVPLGDDLTATPHLGEEYDVLFRLPAGLDRDGLAERLDTLAGALQESAPREQQWQVLLREFGGFRANRGTRQALWLLTGAMAVMLVVAIVNAVNLMLLRASTRRVDIETRRALGATTLRLLQHQASESLILTLLAAGGAVLMARLMVGFFVGMLPREVTFFLVGQIGVDDRVLVFTAATAVAVGMTLSLLPVLRLSGTHKGLRGATPDGRPTRTRRGLVIVEVALSVAVLVTTGLLIRSFLQVTAVDPGYDPSRLLHLTVSLPEQRYPDPASRRAFVLGLSGELQRIPMVESVSVSDGAPPSSGLSFGNQPQAEGGEPKPLPSEIMSWAHVDPAFLRTLGVPLVAGRGFTPADGLEGGVAIVDRALAAFLFGPADPVGRRFRVDVKEDRWLTVVGLIDDLRLNGRDDRHGEFDLLLPLRDTQMPGYVVITLRAASVTADLVGEVRRRVRAADGALPVHSLQTGTAALADSVDGPRFFVSMMSALAAVALVLSLMGTYAVMAYGVRQREREFGIRAAIGAEPQRLRSMVLAQSTGVGVLGVALGLALSLAVTRLLQSQLYAVAPTDPATFAAVAALVLGAALLAGWLPARRAMRVDPAEVLRAE